MSWHLLGLLLGAAFFAVGLRRLRWLASIRPAAQAIVGLFVASIVLWLASDVATGDGPALVDGWTTATILGLAGSACFAALVAWTACLRSRLRAETWLDALLFAVALGVPLWTAVAKPAIEAAPGGAGPIVVWFVVCLTLMYAGGLFVLGGGIWNTPAAVLVAGTVAFVGCEALVRAVNVGYPEGLSAHLPAYLAGLFVTLHPGLDAVLRRGGNPTGIPLSARVWMLGPTVALPLFTLAYCFVQDLPIPTTLIVGSLIVISAVIVLRAVLLERNGVQDWSVPLTISLTTLVVATLATSLAIENRTADVAQRKATAAVRQYAAELQAGQRLAAGARSASPPTLAAIDRQQASADRRAKRARFFTVVSLFFALLTVGALLLRFNRARQRMERQHLKTHDDLTGLPNRHALHRAIDASATTGLSDPRSLLLLDLDDFKAINDDHGQGAGDAVLQTVAGRLQGVGTDGWYVARVEGDTFALLVPGEQADAAAGAVVEVIGEPVWLRDEALSVSVSVGIAPVDENDRSRHAAALRNAEIAMYEAKGVAGNSIATFEHRMYERARDRRQLTADLRDAIRDDQLQLVYQPIVDLTDGRVRGYEALTRWTHPTRGFVSPAEFIPLAEQNGLIVDLGSWVLDTATKQLARWQREWRDERYVSVNVGAAQLTQHRLHEQVQHALEASGLAPELLLLEVTETSLIADLKSSVVEMNRVREFGCRFALDDFGTGYSSLSYLQKFPIDILKVDKAFVDTITEPAGGMLVRAIIDMATGLQLKVVAEGIEELDQAAELQRFGCDYAQGYHFSRPVSVSDVVNGPAVHAVPLPLRIVGESA